MLKKFREKRYIAKHFKVAVPKLELTITRIRNSSDILVIVPTTTGGNWYGVNVATKNLFPNSIFEIPQYYSNCIYSSVELGQICKTISTHQFKKIIFSGFPLYFSKIISELNAQTAGSCDISIIDHGSFSEYFGKNDLFIRMKEYENLHRNSCIHKIGFLKHGIAEFISKRYDIPSMELLNKTTLAGREIPANGNQKKIHIGVFGNHSFNKNVFNQAMAGLLIKDAVIHVLNYSNIFDNFDERIIVHPFFSDREKFFELMGRMSVNMHLSFSEAYPQLVVESMALGVPCLSTRNNGIFEYDDFLEERLIVQQYDNPVAIAEKIESVLKERDAISLKCRDYTQKLNQIADDKLKIFIS